MAKTEPKFPQEITDTELKAKSVTLGAFLST